MRSWKSVARALVLGVDGRADVKQGPERNAMRVRTVMGLGKWATGTM
jgi:hypothetical protein